MPPIIPEWSVQFYTTHGQVAYHLFLSWDGIFSHTEACQSDCVFYSYFQGSWKIEAFSLCVFTSTKSPRGPPWNEGHQPKVLHETSVLEVPAQEQHEHSFYSSSTSTFGTCSL